MPAQTRSRITAIFNTFMRTPRDRFVVGSGWRLDEREQARVFQRCPAVADAREVLRVGGEGQERSHAGLADQQRRVPAFIARPDQEAPAAAVEEHLASGLLQER